MLCSSVEKRQCLYRLNGQAGTGKSGVIHALEKVASLLRCPHVLQVAAPSRIAAHNIGGRTLHSRFSLLPGSNLTSTPLARSNEALLLKDCACLVIDEIYMGLALSSFRQCSAHTLS